MQYVQLARQAWKRAREIRRNGVRAVAPKPVRVILAILLAIMGMLAILLVAGSNAASTESCSGTPVGPAGNAQTMGQFVQYFESQGIAPNGAAGIVGNLQQENGLSPATNSGGVGMAQWDPAVRGPAMQAWDQQHGLDPATTRGQLAYIVYDLRTHYVVLLAALNGATSPAQAADLFEATYEAAGIPALSNRESYAVAALQAAGGALSTVYVSLATCATSAGGDPIPGFTPSRDDMGVDACSTVGQPIYAVADSTLVDVLYGWYAGQPLLLFQFNPPVAGTYQGDQYWYVAEQIVPASTTLGTTFAAGQPVATYAASGTCIEMGWGSPTTGSRTLVPADANPPAGGLTPEAEAWKAFAHIPWLGVSP